MIFQFTGKIATPKGLVDFVKYNRDILKFGLAL